MVYNIYIIWELYLLLLKIFIFVKKKKIIFGFDGAGSWLLVVKLFFFLTSKNIRKGSGWKG